MKTQVTYEAPGAVVYALGAGEVICQSNLRFSGPDRAGDDIDQEDIINGGDF